MSLSRLVTRALALNALLPQDGDGDQITMAGANVFDSALDPMQFDRNGKDIPAITVYTDEDDAVLIHQASGHGLYRRHVTLRIEIILGSFDEIVTDGKTFVTYGLPMTDAQMEARLDIFEQQVRWALFQWPDRKATAAFTRYVIRVASLTSHVQRDESGNNKLAARSLTIKCEIPDDCPPTWGFSSARVSPVELKPEDFPVTPWLQDMLASVQNAPSMQAPLQMLAGSGAPVAQLAMFKRLGVKVDLVKPANQSLLASLGKTRGPDGQLELQAVWEISK